MLARLRSMTGTGIRPRRSQFSLGSPFEEKIPAKNRADAVGELAEARTAGDRKHVAWIPVIGEIEDLQSHVSGPSAHRDRLVGNHVSRHERRERASVWRTIVRISGCQRRERKTRPPF